MIIIYITIEGVLSYAEENSRYINVYDAAGSGTHRRRNDNQQLKGRTGEYI